MNKQMIGLGVMSGSSLDGIDFAIVKFSDGKHQVLETKSMDFDQDLMVALPKAIELNLQDYLLLEPYIKILNLSFLMKLLML